MGDMGMAPCPPLLPRMQEPELAHRGGQRAARQATREGQEGEEGLMGREVRRVPADWQHPKDERGEYVPLFDGYTERVERWDREAAKWNEGLVYNWGHERRGELEWKPRPETDCATFEEWDGRRPCAKDYMPDWPADQRTHLQMYETCTEGTPISPVCATPEDLARWLADTGASACGNETASYEAWLSVCRGRPAPSMVIRGGVFMSGVEAQHETAKRTG